MHKVLLTAILLIVALEARADVDIQIPGAQSPMPLYFSGTNARAGATAEIRNGTLGILSATLYLIGDVKNPSTGQVTHDKEEVVRAFVAPSSPPGTPPVYVPSVELKVMFNSAHFGVDGTGSIRVRLSVTDTSGATTVKTSDPVPIKNIAAIYGLHEFEVKTNLSDGATKAKPELQAMNQSTTAFHTEAGWTKQQCYADIKHCSVFYVNTHADQSLGIEVFITGEGSQIPNLICAVPFLGQLDVDTGRKEAIGATVAGTTLPPFNPSAEPPISIAWVDGCKSGVSDQFGSFIFPKKNRYSGNNIENQCVLAWKVDVAEEKSADVSTLFWYTLLNGSTVNLLIDNLVEAAFPDADIQNPETYLRVIGDKKTRLFAVYTGDDSALVPADWFRPL